MKGSARFWAVIALAVLLSGCSFFRKDLKTTTDMAESDNPAIVQNPSGSESAPAEGVIGLERAQKDAFDWDAGAKTQSPQAAPERAAALGAGSPGPAQPSLALRNDAGGDRIEGPPVIPPEPFGQPPRRREQPLPPLASAPPPSPPLAQASTGLDRDRLSSDPLSGPGPLSLPDKGPASSFLANQNQGFGSTPPTGFSPSGFASQPKHDSTGMNVAHAIKPSGLSAEGPDPWDGEKEAVGSTARPPGSSRPGGFSSAPAQGAGEVQTPPPIPPRREARSEDPLLVSKGPSRNDAAGGSRSREPAAQDPLPDAKTLKERGVDQYKKRQFDDAILTFRRYLGAYPDDSQEVRWRLAQALFETNRWGEATQEFNELRGSPQADYRADAILKLGMIDQKKGDMVSARQQWKRVVETYPNTEAAKKASKFLAESP